MKMWMLIQASLVCILLDWRSAAAADQKWGTERDFQEIRRVEVDSEMTDNSKGCRGRELKDMLRWLDETDEQYRRLSSALAYTNWDFMTNMTDENSDKLEKVDSLVSQWMQRTNKKVAIFYSSYLRDCNETASRLLKKFLTKDGVPVAKSESTQRALTDLSTKMSKIYSMATVVREGKRYRLEPDLVKLMASSRDADLLLWAWTAWRNATGPQIRPLYVQLVDYMNEAARDNGYRDTAESWLIADYESTDVESSLDDLYNKLRPFYEHLHAYIRRRLRSAYPAVEILNNGMIPAHLLGNMWAQQWSNIYDIAIPYPEQPTINITRSLISNGYTVEKMFKTAEDFFLSLGLEPMTEKFWRNSMITRPEDGREVECHGSAEDFLTQNDFRIKMCATVSKEDFQTVHHEMGHIEYFMLYKHQPALFRGGANAAFHEAVGDTIALSADSLTHLAKLNLLNSTRETSSSSLYKQQINYLMLKALEKVAFLPFAYVMDKWRFAVFRKEITPDKYNKEWWRMRQKYEGIKAPIGRTENDFDPGSKYHIPSNVPYSRYFLSFIGQFQFHETLCSLAEKDDLLHNCDIYQSTAAGQKLRTVLSLGASKPWPEVMKLFTGQPEFKVDSVLEYFSPLITWLKRANRNSEVGWMTEVDD